MVRKTRRRTQGAERRKSRALSAVSAYPRHSGIHKTQKDPDGEYSLGAQHYSVPDGALLEGEIHESPCPPLENGDEFESWKRTGDIVAAFFGHDHVNTFTMEVDGIKLVQSPGAGYHSYGDKRGGRLIIIDENKPDSYESECIFIDRITQGELK